MLSEKGSLKFVSHSDWGKILGQEVREIQMPPKKESKITSKYTDK